MCTMEVFVELCSTSSWQRPACRLDIKIIKMNHTALLSNTQCFILLTFLAFLPSSEVVFGLFRLKTSEADILRLALLEPKRRIQQGNTAASLFGLPENLYSLNAWWSDLLTCDLLVCRWDQFKPKANAGTLERPVIFKKHCDAPLNYWCLSHQESSDKVSNRLNADTTLTPRLHLELNIFPSFNWWASKFILWGPLLLENVKPWFSLAFNWMDGLPFIGVWPEAVITLPVSQRIYYVCTVNLEVTFSPDAPLSRAGAWNCLQPQEMRETISRSAFSNPSPLSKSLNRLLLFPFILWWGKSTNWFGNVLNFMK